MKRARAALALISVSLACLAMTACSGIKSFEGTWHLDREHTTMPMGFNVKAESYMQIEMKGDGIDMHDYLVSPETGKFPLLDRHYSLDGQEHVAESDGNSTLYISARLEGSTLRTQERIVHHDRGTPEPETRLSVTYVLSRFSGTMVGTDEQGKIVTYDRQ